MLSVEALTGQKDNLAMINATLEIENIAQLTRILTKIDRLPNVVDGQTQSGLRHSTSARTKSLDSDPNTVATIPRGFLGELAYNARRHEAITNIDIPSFPVKAAADCDADSLLFSPLKIADSSGSPK